MKEEYEINGYGKHPYYSVIVDYVFNPKNWALEIKYQSDGMSNEDLVKYIQEIHPLLYKKGIKRIERNEGLKKSETFSHYYTITIYF